MNKNHENYYTEVKTMIILKVIALVIIARIWVMMIMDAHEISKSRERFNKLATEEA